MASTIGNQFNRISGLESGLDTETLVKQLTKVNQLKIDAATQQKQVIEWKRDFYQEITGKLYDFSNKYFGSSTSNLIVNDSIKLYSAKNFSSPYLNVSPSASSSSGSVYIDDIVSLASAAKLQSSASVTAKPELIANPLTVAGLSGRSFKVTLDGTEKTLTFSDRTYADSTDVSEELQSLLDTAFGTNRVNVSVDGDLVQLASAGSLLTINDTGIAGEEVSEIAYFQDGASNYIDTSKNLSDISLNAYIGDSFAFTINGKSFSFTSADSMSSIMKAVNASDAGVTMSYSKMTDKFTLTSKTTGSAQSITIADVNGSFTEALFGMGEYTAGSDAVVILSTNGSKDAGSLTTITRSTNSFEVDGTAYTLLGKAAAAAKEQLSVDIALDVDASAERIKAFVNDYNTLLSSITSKLSEKRYKDFAPLTDEHKKELSESEVTTWTEKAKSGLLNNDIYLKSIANDLRGSLFADVKKVGTSDSIGTMLADIGITTTIYSEKGQLHIDEQKLKKALNENPDGVMNLFTQKASISYSLYASDEQKTTRYNESGLFWRLSDILKTNLNNAGRKGALIELIGSPSNTYSGETMYSKKIAAMETTIQKLNDKLTADENRYWKQFTAMETALSKMNKQSAWLSSQLSSQQS